MAPKRYMAVPDGLADQPDFLLYMVLVKNTAWPWFKISENDPPASNLASILLQACVTQQPWTGDPSKLGRRAARPSLFAGAFLCVFRGVLVQLRFNDVRCFGGFKCRSHPWTWIRQPPRLRQGHRARMAKQRLARSPAAIALASALQYGRG